MGQDAQRTIAMACDARETEGGVRHTFTDCSDTIGGEERFETAHAPHVPHGTDSSRIVLAPHTAAE